MARALRITLLVLAFITGALGIISMRNYLPIFPMTMVRMRVAPSMAIDRGRLVLNYDKPITGSPVSQRWEFLGVGYRVNHEFAGPTTWVPEVTIDLRLWPVFWLLATYPMGYHIFIPIRNARRRANQQCIGCKYLMLGNESEVCPECGLPQDAGILPQWVRIAVATLVAFLAGLLFEYINTLAAFDSRIVVLCLRWFETDVGSWLVLAGVRTMLYWAVGIATYLHLSADYRRQVR